MKRHENNSIRHFIITRFNLSRSGWKADKNNEQIVLNEDWLEARFSLFETFCYPSVKAQVNLNFEWLVYFDRQTPDLFKDRVRKYESEFRQFKPRFIDGMDNLLREVKADISYIKTDLVITSRLDNDDCLSSDYVATIQETVSRSGMRAGVIDFPKGYCLKIEPVFKLFYSIQYSNAFLSFVEPFNSKEALKTVFHRNHTELAFKVKTIQVCNKALWMQTIHGRNVLNQAQGFEMDLHQIPKDFGLQHIQLTRLHGWQRIKEFYLLRPLYLTKKSIKNLVIRFRAL